MKIDRTMDLSQLAEHMGSSATREEAAEMRNLLLPAHDGQDTTDVPEDVWLRLIDKATGALTPWRYESDGDEGHRTHYAVREVPYAPCGVERRDFKSASEARRFVEEANSPDDDGV